MFQWVAIAICFHILAICLTTMPYPQLSTVCWKLGNLTLAAYFGYAIDRHLFRDRLDDKSLPMRQIRRAVVVVGAMIAVALGM